MNLSKKIKKARNDKKLTQDQVANSINVSRKTLSAWENDRSIPDIESIKNLSNVLGKDIAYFISDNSVKNKNHLFDYINIINISVVIINILVILFNINIYGLTFLNISIDIILLIMNKNFNQETKIKYKKLIIIILFIILCVAAINHSFIILNRLSYGGLIGALIKTIILTININFIINYLETKLK